MSKMCPMFPKKKTWSLRRMSNHSFGPISPLGERCQNLPSHRPTWKCTAFLICSSVLLMKVVFQEGVRFGSNNVSSKQTMLLERPKATQSCAMLRRPAGKIRGFHKKRCWNVLRRADCATPMMDFCLESSRVACPVVGSNPQGTGPGVEGRSFH